MTARLVLLIVFCAVAAVQASAETIVRIATYNIRVFTSAAGSARIANLRELVRELDADVIGLQEIRDRTALERVFPPDQWDIVIDDDSTAPPGELNQDLAVVVRRPLRVKGMPNDLDADDRHFLFPSNSQNYHFPRRRDVLAVEVEIPSEEVSFYVMVHHAKARGNPNRPETDPQREGASRDLIRTLEHDYHEVDYILLGDFNDNPDDRSLNILETGNPVAVAGQENTQGGFLVNLTESLLLDDHVSYGLDANDIDNGRIETTKPGMRQENNEKRGQDYFGREVLLDQILIPRRLLGRYDPGSVHVFDHPSGVRGSWQARASDHLPMFADFVFGTNGGDAPRPSLAISAVLPDPNGSDRGNEQVMLANTSGSAVER